MSTPTAAPARQLSDAIYELLSDAGLPIVGYEGGQTMGIKIGEAVFGLVITDGVPDPLVWVTVGTEMGKPRTDDEVRCPYDFSSGRHCSRASGHPGQHIAWAGNSRTAEGTALEVEINRDAPTTTTTGAAYSTGGTGGSGSDVESIVNSLHKGDRIPDSLADTMGDFGNLCQMSNGTGFECTRKDGHTGKHVATYGLGVSMEVCCDPYDTPTVDIEHCEPGDPDPTKGPNQTNPCNHNCDGDPCTRPYLHSGQHVAGDGKRVRDIAEADA